MLTTKQESLVRYYTERIAYHKARVDEPGRRGPAHRRKATIYRTRLDQAKHGVRAKNCRCVL